MPTLALVVSLFCQAETPAAAPALDLAWPSWRGPTADGIAAAAADPPTVWSEERNVRWKVALPGLGNSTPLVVGGRLFLTAAIDLDAPTGGTPEAPAYGPQPAAPNAKGVHRSIVIALDRATGKELWRTTVHEGVPHEKGHATGSHASASPITDGQRLIASFGSRGLFALDLDGKVLWSKQLGQMKTLAGFGEGSSPALYGDTVVVQWDEEGPSFLAAYDARTGDERWKRAREVDSSWGSPTIAVVEGRAQVVATGSDVTRGYDLATGEPLWSCAGMSKNPVNSAVVAGGVAYVTNAYMGDVIQALRLTGAKGALEAGQGLLWARKGVGSYVPTPVVHGGRMYFLRESSGVLTCLDAATGAPIYQGQRLGDVKTVHASPVLVPTGGTGRLYCPAREGTTVVVKAGDVFEVLATNSLDDVFDASPVVVARELFLRGRSNLYCIAEAQ